MLLTSSRHTAYQAYLNILSSQFPKKK